MWILDIYLQAELVELALAANTQVKFGSVFHLQSCNF